MNEDMFAYLLFGGFAIVVVVLLIRGAVIGKRYMKEQKETGADKRKVLDVMTQVMKERLDEYTLAIGNYTRTERYGRTTTHYYYSYILAFNEAELVIFPFVVKDKQVLLRNCMQINWNDVKFYYKIGTDGMDMTIGVMGENLIIKVPKVQKSAGIENSAEPIGVYQEAEVEKLISYLPRYKEYAKK